MATVVVQSSATSPTNFGTLGIGPFSTVGTLAPQVANLNLVAGINAVTVPAGAVGCVVTPPTANAVALNAWAAPGSGGTVALTQVAGAVTAVAIGTAGTGYPISTTFMAAPVQSGGAGCRFAVTTNGSGVPTAVTFIAGAGGTGYTSATVPWVLADAGVAVPLGAPCLLLWNALALPATVNINAASATTGQTQLVFF